mmetsp:Transcript_17108/g.36949  ORF Transcript_17108/g.36949 Transcript_17108/m.36949 type:complete len:250 (-) Transcript_17108:141-890(-)
MPWSNRVCASCEEVVILWWKPCRSYTYSLSRGVTGVHEKREVARTSFLAGGATTSLTSSLTSSLDSGALGAGLASSATAFSLSFAGSAAAGFACPVLGFANSCSLRVNAASSDASVLLAAGGGAGGVLGFSTPLKMPLYLGFVGSGKKVLNSIGIPGNSTSTSGRASSIAAATPVAGPNITLVVAAIWNICLPNSWRAECCLSEADVLSAFSLPDTADAAIFLGTPAKGCFLHCFTPTRDTPFRGRRQL